MEKPFISRPHMLAIAALIVFHVAVTVYAVWFIDPAALGPVTP